MKQFQQLLPWKEMKQDQLNVNSYFITGGTIFSGFDVTVVALAYRHVVRFFLQEQV